MPFDLVTNAPDFLLVNELLLDVEAFDDVFGARNQLHALSVGPDLAALDLFPQTQTL